MGKRDGSLRLVVDARPANRLFESPPGVQLSTVENFGRLHVDRSETLYLSKGDVQNCFYRLRIEGKLVEYFAMPSVLASEVDAGSVDGVEVLPTTPLFHVSVCCLWDSLGRCILHSVP